MKITFLGAGSTVFCKNVLGDCILSDKLDKVYKEGLQSGKEE
jgi:alpha-galactosidase/6-phospho-beta-glucosidase family protein